MVAILLVLAAHQVGGNIPLASTLTLSPSVHPLIELPIFKSLDCVTANEYWTLDEKTGMKIYVRVVRYTYPADYAKEKKRWGKELAKSAGWNGFQETPVGEAIARKVDNLKVLGQSLVLHHGRIKVDVTVAGWTKVLDEPGWVWVSVNETLAPGFQSPDWPKG